MNTLTERQAAILHSLRETVHPRDAEILSQIIRGDLDNRDIQRACELINDEYLMKGMQEDYSPNIYGKELEALLNSVNAARLS